MLKMTVTSKKTLQGHFRELQGAADMITDQIQMTAVDDGNRITEQLIKSVKT